MIATTNRKTRKGEPETGTDGSSQTLQNPRVDGYGYGFGPPRSSGSGFWTGLEPNRTVFPVQTRTAGGLPGPVANTTLLHSKSPLKLTIRLPPSAVHIWCWQMDLHWRITDTAPTGGVCGWQQHPDDNVGVSHINTGNRPCKDSQFWPPMNQFHPPPGYSYLTAQPPFPGAPLFYHRAPFNMTPSSEPISGATQGYPSYRPSWQGYDSPQRRYGGHQMFPPQQFAGQGPSSPGAPRVPPAPPGNNAVILPTSSASTPYEQHPGAPGRPPIALPMKQFQQTAELRSADFAGIQDLPQLPRIS